MKQKKTAPHHKRVHNYYKRTGFYGFISTSLKKALPPIIIVVIGVLLFNKYVYDLDQGLRKMTEAFSSEQVYSFFYVSESILLGIIPPEIFIAWAKKTSSPITSVSLLATLSYLGGLSIYFVGLASLRIGAVKQYLEVKMAKNIKNTKKWGGILILVGALLPLPFAISCLTAGMIKYPFKKVVLFGLFRFLRFAVYAWAIFSVVSK